MWSFVGKFLLKHLLGSVLASPKRREKATPDERDTSVGAAALRRALKGD